MSDVVIQTSRVFYFNYHDRTRMQRKYPKMSSICVGRRLTNILRNKHKFQLR